MDEYDADFLYPATYSGYSMHLKHAVCSEIWGGCGHVVLGTSYQSCVELWNKPTPDMAYKFLPIMEQNIAVYEVKHRKWFSECLRTCIFDNTTEPLPWWRPTPEYFGVTRSPQRDRKET